MTDSEKLMLRLFNIKNVCRLCSTKMDIVSIFHKKFDFPQKMDAIVLTLTTVAVTKQDEISQNICSKCVAVVIKMFQFRDQAIKNDQSLKAQYEELNKIVKKSNEKDNVEKIQTDQEKINSEPTVEVSTEPPKENRKLNVTKIAPVVKREQIMKVSVKTQEEKKMEGKDKMSAKLPEEKIESKIKVSQRTKPNYTIHSSVASLFRQYNKIRVPTVCLSSNMEPRVVMEMDAVENYFKSKKLNMYKYVNLALNQPRKVAVKHTLSNNQHHNLQNIVRQQFGQQKKRKFSGDDSSSEKSVKKTSVREDNPDLSVASSQMLHICGVCSSVHSRAMHLTRHMTKHLNCQFCKSKFKTLEIKEKHVESECKIQKIMKSMIHLPEIPLQKIELDANVKREFYKTFDSYGLIPKIEMKTIENSRKKILSNVIIPTTINKNSTINIDITIKNHSGLNSLLLNNSTDIKIIKNLLVQYNKLHRKMNNASQTFLPTNELIKVNHGDLTIELKSLKQHLFYYKIPIDVKNGSTVNVCYKYDSSDKTSRELKHWKHLTPVDVSFRTNKNILNRFDPIAADKEIKQELINMEHTEMEEIPIEELYNLSLPTSKNVSDDNCGREIDSFCDAILITGTRANRLPEVIEIEVDKNLTGFENLGESRVAKESITVDGKVSNMEVSSTSDDQQIYAETDCLNAVPFSENQNVELAMIPRMILEPTGDENIVTIQDKNLSSSTNEDVSFLHDYSENNPSNIRVVEDVNINPGTSQEGVPIRVKTVSEINE